MDYSTKLSGYLAQGCITARQVHEELLHSKMEQIKNTHIATDRTAAFSSDLAWWSAR
ncbi:hypothetical protein F4801DRAFT_529446 [Xylaria longipes]|nr:hypothetical protein F4801DRAFT_529446 [Xylaria longipes]